MMSYIMTGLALSQEELQSHFPLKTLKLGNFAPWHKLFNTLTAAFSLMVFVIYIAALFLR